MAALASLLSEQLNVPVRDATGLTGKYEFTLSWLAREMPGESTTADPLEVALIQQLGLRLERKRGEAEILVVDQLEKAPSAN